MLLPCVSPSCRVSPALELGEETFTDDAIRSLVTPEREKEGVSSLSLEASKPDWEPTLSGIYHQGN